MNESIRTLPIIFAGVALNALAQIFLKFAMEEVGRFAFALENALPIARKVLTTWGFYAGGVCYVASLIFWLMALSRVEVNFAYPMMSLGYVMALGLGFVLLGEQVTPVRLLGVAVIVVGVVLISRTGV